MDWNDIIQSRHTTFAWDYDREVDPQIIKDVLYENWRHAPTKNLKYPFICKVIKNDDLERRKEIMTICHRNADMTIERDYGNPQVLAPYLIGFCQRDVRDLEVIYQPTYTRNSESVNRYDFLEVGIQSTFIMLGLKNRGLDTGITQNCCNDPDRVAELFGLPERCIVVIGVGYSKGLGPNTYLDPRTDTVKSIPYAPENRDKIYPRPAFDVIYKVEEI